MYEFIFELYILRYLNYAWIFIWIVYFKVFELYMKKISLWFYDPFLLSEFILDFPCRFKNIFLTTLNSELMGPASWPKVLESLNIIKSINIKKYNYLCYKYYFFIIIKSINIKNSIICIINIIIFIRINIINKIVNKFEKNIIINIENKHRFDLKCKIIIIIIIIITINKF
jgi:hypothetical protein